MWGVEAIIESTEKSIFERENVNGFPFPNFIFSPNKGGKAKGDGCMKCSLFVIENVGSGAKLKGGKTNVFGAL